MSVLNLDRGIDKILGLEDVGIGNLRFNEWGKKYLWKVKFDVANTVLMEQLGPFKEFFPATDVEVLAANVDSFAFDLHLSAFKIPQKSEIKDINLTFLDNEQSTLFKWFSDWMNIDLLNNGNFISALLDKHQVGDIQGDFVDSFGSGFRRVSPLRRLQVQRLDTQQKPIAQNTYTVFPEGQLTFNGGSESAPVAYTIKFIIVGQTSDELNESKSTATSIAKDIVGRFI